MTGLAPRVVIAMTDRGFGPAEWSTVTALIAAIVAVDTGDEEMEAEGKTDQASRAT